MNKKELGIWINYLISVNKVDSFYHSKDWKKLKKEVLTEQHYECQRCLREHKLTLLNDGSPVHHIKELRQHPELALSKFYIDEQGQIKRQLEALCFDCHNKEHNRFIKKEKFTNKERW